MNYYSEDKMDIIFGGLLSNVLTQIRDSFEKDRWIDIEVHFFSTDSGKDILLARDGEYIHYLISKDVLCIKYYAAIYGNGDIYFEKNKEGILNFEKMYNEFNQGFFKDWHNFFRKTNL